MDRALGIGLLGAAMVAIVYALFRPKKAYAAPLPAEDVLPDQPAKVAPKAAPAPAQPPPAASGGVYGTPIGEAVVGEWYRLPGRNVEIALVERIRGDDGPRWARFDWSTQETYNRANGFRFLTTDEYDALVTDPNVTFVEPCLQIAPGVPYGTRSDRAAMIHHDKCVSEKLAKAGYKVGPFVGSKLWVQNDPGDKRAADGQPAGANYGWFRSRNKGDKWQGKGHAHNRKHIDPSQLVFVARDV